MRALLASFVLGALLAPCCMSNLGAARAQQTPSSPAQPPLREACRADVQKFCADVHPGAGGIGRCLLAHKNGLSSPCRDGLARVGADPPARVPAGKTR